MDSWQHYFQRVLLPSILHRPPPRCVLGCLPDTDEQRLDCVRLDCVRICHATDGDTQSLVYLLMGCSTQEMTQLTQLLDRLAKSYASDTRMMVLDHTVRRVLLSDALSLHSVELKLHDMSAPIEEAKLNGVFVFSVPPSCVLQWEVATSLANSY